MISVDSILIFVLIFSCLTIIRTMFRFVISLSKVEVFKLNNLELITNGLTLSYIITYILS